MIIENFPDHPPRARAIRHWPGRTESRRGFTLLELMVVMAIIVVLATIGVVRYQKTIERSKEAALRTDLRDMREAIQNYTRDKEAAPTSLDDLVSAQYIARVPNDPVTGQPDWNVDQCDMVLDPDQSSGGICDVHSGSDAVSPFENTPYNSW
jgi:general secretion pathway protein G